MIIIDKKSDKKIIAMEYWKNGYDYNQRFRNVSALNNP